MPSGTTIEIKEGTISISPSAFSGCSGLTSVIIPNSVTSIGSYAFYDCSLKSLTIGAGILSIGSDQCKPIKTIWLTNTPPSGYKNLQGYINYVANDQYSGLSNVKVYPYLSSAFETGGVKYVPVSPAERTCDAIDCSYDSTVVGINIGETVSFKGVEMKVQNVMPYTVYKQTSVKTLSVSHSGDIGNYAFYGCTGITDATISNEGNIGESAFEGAMTSDNAVLKVSNKGDIYPKAFYGCTALKTANVEIGETIQTEEETIIFADWVSTNKSHNSSSSEIYTFTISKNAVLSFNWNVSSESNCDKLIVTLDGTTILQKSGSYSGTYSGKVGQGSHTLVVKYTKDGSQSSGADKAEVYGIMVVGGVFVSGAIFSEAFRGCTALETLTLGENMISIGESAFRGCSKLLAVTIPNKTTSLGTYSFDGCTLLKQLDLGNGVQSIGGYSFNGCSALPSIDIPASVTSVGDYTFKGCTSIADVVIKDRTTDLSLGSNGSSPLFADCPLDSVYIGGNISYSTSSSYGYSPFYRNTSLRSVVITDKEEEISDNEFYGCTNLKNVSIGSNVKKIGNWAFSGCSNLDYFSFGKSVENIGEEAFSDCVNMTQLISHAVTPPTCGTQALDDINKWNCTLKIPEGTNSAYMAANQWKEFFFIENLQGGLRYQVTFVVDGETVATDSVKLGSTIDLPEPPVKEGYTFTGWENVPEIMPANDITINGSFKVNSYAVKYIVDGVDYATDSVEYGAVVTLIDELEKEGYSFSWSEAPETMPANDITITGEWSINSYLVTFIIDGEVYATDSVEYGAAITLPEVPEKENSTFEWEEAPETMPASDVTIYGNYVSGIGGVTISGKADVYTLNGMLYKRDVDLNNLSIELPKGVYIINGKKVMVK